MFISYDKELKVLAFIDKCISKGMNSMTEIFKRDIYKGLSKVLNMKSTPLDSIRELFKNQNIFIVEQKFQGIISGNFLLMVNQKNLNKLASFLYSNYSINQLGDVEISSEDSFVEVTNIFFNSVIEEIMNQKSIYLKLTYPDI